MEGLIALLVVFIYFDVSSISRQLDRMEELLNPSEEPVIDKE